MASKIFEKAMNDVTPEQMAFIRMSVDLVKKIHETLKMKGMSQTDLANALGKSPSEISKWLSGMHNFTFKSIARLEMVLGVPLIATPAEKIEDEVGFGEAIDSIVNDLVMLKEQRQRAAA